MQEEFLEVFRSPFFFVYASVLFSCIVISSGQLGDTVELEFIAYRLHQFDIAGNQRGSRTWKVMYEAVSLKSDVMRRCLVVEWKDLIGKDLNSLFGQPMGAVLVILPKDIDELTNIERIRMQELDKALYALNTDMAIYFALQSPTVKALSSEINKFSQRAPSAIQQLLSAVAANTFQFSSSLSINNNLITPKAMNIVGRLWASDRNSPTVLIVAHYDSHSAIPEYSEGADSNGSGVVSLLELLAIFSQFYSSAITRPKYNIFFLLSTGGKFNYQGSRQWIDDHVEKQSDHNIELVICLDTLGGGDDLFMHVSKMPSDSSPIGVMFHRLNSSIPSSRNLSIVYKKISMYADYLSWEHERYSIRRLRAFTISRLDSPYDPIRTSILDTTKQLDISALKNNIRVIGEAILSYVFALPVHACQSKETDSNICSVLTENAVQSQRITQWINQFANRARPLANTPEDLVASLKDIVARYSRSETKLEPVSFVDLTLFGVLSDRILAHRVKPAVFELVLAVFIALYLFGLHFVVQNIQWCSEMILTKFKKL